MKRASSTSIRTYLGCPRKAVFEFGDDAREKPTSLPMAIGTVTHAVLELRVQGLEVSEPNIRGMKGNYDDPVVALDAFPNDHVYEIALASADAVGDPRQFIEEFFGSKVDRFEIEWDLETEGLSFAIGTRAGGYIDLLIYLEDGRVVVWDWKTRSRLDYIPRTDADFRADPQLCYYGSAISTFVHPELEELTIGHGNILRADVSGGPKVVPIASAVPDWYLKSVWSYLNTVATEMAHDMHAGPTKARRNDNACYKYGPCPHMGYCATGGQPRKPFFQWAKSTDLTHLTGG